MFLSNAAPIFLPFLNRKAFEVEKNQEYEQQQQHECEDLPFVILIIDRTMITNRTAFIAYKAWGSIHSAEIPT